MFENTISTDLHRDFKPKLALKVLSNFERLLLAQPVAPSDCQNHYI